MSFMSSLKRVQAALTTGGASLLASKETQEKIGTGVFVGGALTALGAGAGVLGAGGTLAQAGTAAGTTGFNIGTFGTQLLGKAVPALMSMAGVGAPPGGGAPADSMPATLSPTRRNGNGFMTTGLTPGGGFAGVPEAFGGEFVPTAAGGMIGRAAGGVIGGISRMAGNLVLAASGRIRGLVTQAGQFLSARRVFSGVKVLGIAGASAAMGVSIDQVAQIVLQESMRKRRRGRGISAANLSTTRSTVRKITRMHRDLAQLCGQAGMPRRRARPAITPHLHAVA